MGDEMKTNKAALLLGLLSTTIATNVDARKNFRTGAYFGAEVGWLHDDMNFRETRSGSFFTGTRKNHSSKDANSVLPGLFMGYRHFMDCYFIGAEFSANLNFSEASTKRFTDPFSPSVTKYKMEGQYNLIPTFIFGRAFTEYLGVYGKVGADFAMYRFKGREHSSRTGALTNRAHKDKSYNRLLIGGGVEYAINCIWSTRADFTYSFQDSQSFHMNPKATAPAAINNNHIRVKISSLALKWGVFVKL